MKRKQTPPIPLQLVKDFEADYPGCWELADFVRAGRGNPLPEWNELCWLPLAGAQSVMINEYKEQDLNISALYAALASWRQYKEIYSFSPELTETLYSQGDEDIVIPTDILFNLPYPCIYVSTGENEGFFVFFEQDMETMQMELRFCIISQGANGKLDILNDWLHLGVGYTISDGIAEGIKLIKKNMQNPEFKLKSQGGEYTKKSAEELATRLYDEVSKRIQLVLYICAENAEIEENPQQKQITRKPPKGAKPRDAYREIRKWDVGVKFAKKVRKAESSPTERAERTDSSQRRSSPRPHTRRGHWHHYWTGSRADGSRKLILKWTAPVFIGGDPEDMITTINVKD